MLDALTSSGEISATGLLTSIPSKVGGALAYAGATVTIRDGSASGKVLLHIQAPAGESREAFSERAICANSGIHITVSGGNCLVYYMLG